MSSFIPLWPICDNGGQPSGFRQETDHGGSQLYTSVACLNLCEVPWRVNLERRSLVPFILLGFKCASVNAQLNPQGTVVGGRRGELLLSLALR
jgi:hypothetical protein